MSLKNLSAIKIPKILKKKFNNKKFYNLYTKFEKEFILNDKFIVAV